MIKRTEPFRAVSMPCTEKQFEKELKPILEFLGVGVDEVYDLYTYKYITTNYAGVDYRIGSISRDKINNRNRQYHPRFCPKTFIESLGYDYGAVLKAMQQKSKQTHYKVLRPILFFAKDNVVHKETLKKYFTKKAIKAFIKDKYIK